MAKRKRRKSRQKRDTSAASLKSASALLGWSSAVAAVVALAVGCGTLVIVLGDLRTQLAYKKFSDSMRAPSSEVDSEAALKRIPTNLRLYLWLRSKPRATLRRHFAEKQQILEELHKIIWKLRTNEFDRASLRFTALRSKGLDALLQTIQVDSDVMALYGSIITGSTNFHRQVKELDSRLRNTPTALEDNQNRISQQILLAQDLALDFGSLLSLKPLGAARGGTSVGFYKAGVLKDLPVLQDLRDNIDSLSELKDELDRIGGRVDIEGPNAPEVFGKRLTRLKNSGSMFSTEISKLEVENEQLQSRLEELRKEVLTSSLTLEEQLRAFIRHAARPRIGWLGRNIFDRFELVSG